MKMNLEEFFKKIKLTTTKDSRWFEDGYKTIQFRNTGLAMTHKTKGDFAWIYPSEIEIEIPDELINKPVETTNEQPKIIVEIIGGVAYCNDPRVEIIDYD